MSNGVDGTITRARRRCLVKIVRANEGALVKDVLAACQLLHEKGDWPQASWAGARNEPYYGGISQMLSSLCWRGDGEGDRLVLDYGERRYYTLKGAEKIADGFLPQGEEREVCTQLIDRFQRDSGMEMALGVYDGSRQSFFDRLMPIVRVKTPRGIIDWPKKGDWESAIDRAALELGYDLQ